MWWWLISPFYHFLLFSMCHSKHVTVNTWLKCSFFYINLHISSCWLSQISGCCKGDDQSQWETPDFGYPERPNPLTDRLEIWRGSLRRRYDPTRQKLWKSAPHCGIGVKYHVQMFFLFFYFLLTFCAALENTFLGVSPPFLCQTTWFGEDWFPRGVWTSTPTSFPT